MPVPDFQSLMLPLLRLAADGHVHSLAEARDALATQFKLSDTDLQELLPSGRQQKFANRVAWAKSYLQQAGLLLSPRRAHFQISDRGQSVLKTPPPRIDIKFLEQYQEFVDFRTPKSVDQVPTDVQSIQPEPDTPEEALEVAHQKVRAGLVSDLLQKVQGVSPKFFETLVVELLLRMGYGGSRYDAGQAIGRSGDEGIDGIISEDRLGLDVIYLQAKRWDGTVGRPEIQRFVGALHGKRARKGVFIATSAFSAEAAAYTDNIDPKVVLIDGRRLAELMIDFGMGVTTVASYEVKRIDSDYFDETGIA
jgi:restriction system protein